MGWFSSDGCGSHHWGEWKATHDVKFESAGMNVKRLHRRHCLHDCDAKEERWRHEGRIEVRSLLESIASLSKEQQRALGNLIDDMQEKDEWRVEHDLERLLFDGSIHPVSSAGIDLTVEGPGWSDDDDE